MADPSKELQTEDSVGRRTFSTAFRGFDQAEVRAYLELLAVEFGTLRDRIEELESELASARASAPEPPRMDRAALTAALGEETARVLLVAEETADELKARAEERFLMAEFGVETYGDYCRRVPMLVPFLPRGRRARGA